MIRLFTIRAAVGAACLLSLGCGEDGMKTARVTGKITYLGDPVTIGTVSFMPEGDAPTATGNLNPDGTYELTTYRTGDGAVLGKHTVMIIAIDPQEGVLPESRSPMPPPIIPDKYLNNLTSGLTAEVKDQDNVIDFELTGELTTKRKKR